MPRSHRRIARLTVPYSTGGPNSLVVGPWVLPTKSANNVAIGAIGNQRVYFDTVSRMGTGKDYSYAQDVGDGTSLSKTISGLQPLTTYYFATTTFVAGIESDYSAETSATTGP